MSASRAEAMRLPWLAPGAESLAALARPSGAPIERFLRTDPGLALLWLRTGAPDPLGADDLAQLLRGALDGLAAPPAGRLDDADTHVHTVLTFARCCALAAQRLALAEGYSSPLRASVAGLLAPLGWIVVAAADRRVLASCLQDPAFRSAPENVQLRHWGWSAAALARHTARHWALPTWLSAAIGNLDLPASLAGRIGGDTAIASIVQRAVQAVSRRGDPLRLADGIARTLSGPALAFEPPSEPWPPLGDAYAQPLLRELLALAVEFDSARRQATVQRLEDENESLRRLVRDQLAQLDDRLRSEKLSALAEFAAGAGHEINNPLAVISGQAQYLLIKETEPDRQRALHAVVQQAQRIHQLLTDLMQFARPSKPQKRLHDLRDTAGAVATNMHEFAALQRVRIELLTPDEPCPVDADPKQVQTAIASLLRNAVEAAREDGWARITIEQRPEQMLVVVEDSGDGPSAVQRVHLFDPFYSGRIAGRGRGLGLPTAWRLAREQGGDLRFDPHPDSPARFVLSLPRAAAFFSQLSMSA